MIRALCGPSRNCEAMGIGCGRKHFEGQSGAARVLLPENAYTPWTNRDDRTMRERKCGVVLRERWVRELVE